MAFEQKDTLIYDELRDVVPTANVVKGEAAVVNDVFGFYMNDWNTTDTDLDYVVFVYKMRQVLADKAVGTGEDIQAGERVYYYPATDTISANAVGTAGTDYYYCGTAKEDAAAAATTIIIRFDGTRYDEAI